VSRAGVGAIAATAVILAIAALAMTPRFVIAAERPAVEAPPAPAIEASVTPVEVAVALPASAAAPAIEAAPAAGPSGISIASITTGPREKERAPSAVSVQLTPLPITIKPLPPIAPKIAFASEGEHGPEPHPRLKRVEREDGDLERRLDRLERMVEDLAKRDKHDRSGGGGEGALFNNKNFNADLNAQIHDQVERAHRDAERAQRDAERAMREQKVAMENHVHIEREHVAQMSNRESLKARRQALEAQRKQIEKELAALEKEIDRNDAEKDKRKDEEKKNKAQDKLEKKTRDKSDSDDDDSRKAK
jgi:DNA repair exonuclease SbcCD ATPase subunit